ncbi:MAG: PQQ-dependent dehydrogenase, methanol/ethanol family [Gammaproteobacteria bacterium]|nr:PQQ-dependent dehydrogenase, methanol/ethanol family [Gammaproteobacteria bacterium]
MYGSRRSKQAGISTAWLAVFLAVALGAAWLLFFREGAPYPMSRQPVPDGARVAATVDDARIVRALGEEPGSWLTYGRTFEEQRFSPLTQIDRETVARLGLAWSKDLGVRHRVQGSPIMVDGVVYVADPWGVTYALDAKTGAELWKFDPEIDPDLVRYACCGGPVNRGVAYYRDRIYLAAFDARLIALDAATGERIWEAFTGDPASRVPTTVTGAPRVGGGNVYIGQSSSEFGVRGYASAWDAETGEEVWRFFTVPGDPSLPFEHPEMEQAAGTWSGQWWEYGGGGTVWHSIVYDPEFDQVYLGVGNGMPWPRAIRSPGGGDNLFLASIVAVDAETGTMNWYYQTTPGDNWDYTATQDMVLADMRVDDVDRKVLLQAPKNGFFYVIDREDGALLRAHPYGPINWATHVDMETGRPVENPDMYYDEEPKWVLPGAGGGHNWHAMSFDPRQGVMYIPTQELPFFFSLPEEFVRTGVFKLNEVGMSFGVRVGGPREHAVEAAGPVPETAGRLKAFDPLTGETLWSTENPTWNNGGVLATAGGVVFQGGEMGPFVAYDADDGSSLWEFQTYGAISAPPISYAVDGTQYVAILASATNRHENFGSLLVFALDGAAQWPAPPERPSEIPEPPPLTASVEEVERGSALYHEACMWCHGDSTLEPLMADLKMMTAETHAQFPAIVLGGMLRDEGMMGYADVLTPEDAELIRQYVISRARIWRETATSSAAVQLDR